MAFMVLTIQKAMLTQQQSELQYQEAIASNHYEQVTEELASLSENNSSMDSPAAKKLEYYQELYESQQTSLEAQLKVIENQLQSYDKAVDSNIKSDCKFSISA